MGWNAGLSRIRSNYLNLMNSVVARLHLKFSETRR